MSKIGRKPIDISNITIDVKGSEIHFKGKKASGVYIVPEQLSIVVEGKALRLIADKNQNCNLIWGMHRALLANELIGADKGFEKQIRIVGLGFKATVSGSKMQLSLGYSHKIEYELPKEVTVDIDKTGQLLTFKSSNKVILGAVCSDIRALRPPEPYKGTGIQYVGETILRKAGKAKSA